jgi:hypothetical protein
MDVESLAKQLILQGMTPEQQKAVLESIRGTMAKSRELQKQKVGEQARLVIEALKKIESDIKSRYDEVGNKIESRVASIKDGKDGRDGTNGRDGRAGRDGSIGPMGPKGADGRNGVDGQDGVDGVSVTDAHIDFDGSLIISLSSGRTINVGEVVAPDLAEKIKVITNGGGTSQVVLDTLASLQTQINNIYPSQTGNAGKFLTTNGTAVSWASVAGGLSYQGTWNASTNTPTLASGVGTNGYYYIVATAGSTNLDGITDWQIGDWLMFNGSVWQKIDQSNLVTSVNGQTGAVSLTYTDVGAFPATSTTGTGNVVLATGATQANPTISNYQDFTSVSAPAYQEGRVWYDTDQKSLSFYHDSSLSPVYIGENIVLKVYNNTGSTIAKGAAVYIKSGGSFTYPDVGLAKADAVGTAAVIGLMNASTPTGTAGYVTSSGVITGVNTAAIAEGTVLYLSPYSAGQLMSTVPPTGYVVQVGVVAHSNNPNGTIYTKQTTPLAISAATITGTLAVNQGGTGQNSALVAGSVVYGVSTTAMGVTAAGTSGQVLTSAGAGTPTWTTPSTGTVTSVGGTGTVNGISLSGTVTSSGNLTLGGTLSGVDLATQVTGTLPIANGGSGQTTAQTAMNAFAGAVTSGSYLRGNGTNVVMAAIQAGDVPTLNQNTTGTASNVTGTVAIANGGTGQTTATAAFNALAPSQTSNSGKYLTTDGTNTSWATVAGGGGVTASNDTSTTSNLYPLFAAATSGTLSTIYTGNAKLLYKPSTGDLQSSAVTASNGIFVNSATVTASYTVASGNNASSAGPLLVDSGVTVTVASGGRWAIV